MGNTLVTLPGYRNVEEIYVGTRTLVYRAIRESDSYPVVIKVLRSEYPNFNELVQFRNQYTIAKNLDLPGIVRPLCLETYRNGYALIIEDFGGISLKDYVTLLTAQGQEVSGKLPITLVPRLCQGTPLPISEFLSIAIQIVSTLDFLIRHRVIHKDIKPANILINPTTKQVKLIDFSIASLLPRETQTLTSPNILEGTLAYLSPEQTGRMNRGIDYRSDFYSLGVTFFELLTGQLPFSSEDAMELVHCHIAKLAPSVQNFNADIPLVISEIVKKLMAKNAEDRYQSALGLKHDLQTCLYQLKETGKIDGFELGKRDLCDRFNIPEKLYGRETEVATLLAAFERVAASRSQAQPGNDLTEALPLGESEAESEAEPLGMRSQVPPGNELGELGKAELMLVAGFSGIGKTAVVNEVHKPIVRQRGYFIKGKFDQFQRNIPFSAFVQAFRDLMGQLLTESDEQIKEWQTKIILALGDQGQVIIEVIPELERIIGKQPPVPELSGTSAQNRFNLLFQKFIQVFTTKEHPLVIFLDDLQWADSASLKLMQLLMSETDTRYLLLIGAYRDNEVQAAHPLILTLGEIEKADATINTINLAPLNQTDLNHLVADTLSCSSELALPLTELLNLKIKGNPFFATQFLKSLHEDGLIKFNLEAGYWQCDLAKIRELSLTDDVVEFMAIQLQKLPEVTQEVLKLAACIGNQFDLGTLSIVQEKPQTETAADLWKALQEGLIIPVSEIYKFFQDGDGEASSQLPITDYQLPSYKFLHDRVQQAAYSLIPEERKKFTHWQIGRLLLIHTPEKEREEKIFEIVNQLNYGVEFIPATAEKEELAQLNLIAAHKAKISTAYGAACSYATVGAKLLAADSWDSQYELTLALFREWAEVEYLNGDFARSQQLIGEIIQKAKSAIERAEIHNLLILEYTTSNQFADAIQAGRSGLKLLGITFPDTDFREAIQVEIALAKENLAGREIAALAEAPEMNLPEQKIAVKLLANMQAPAYFYNVDIWSLATIQCTNLLMKYGNTIEAPFGYTHYGLFNNIELEDYQTGYEFGLLGMKLLDRFSDLAQKCQVYMEFTVYLNIWKKPARLTQSIELQGYQAGLESGNLPWAGYTLAYRLFISIFRGEHLDNILRDISPCLLLGRKTKNKVVVDIALGCQIIVLNLTGKTDEKLAFDSADIGEIELLKTSSLLSQYYIFKSQVLYLYEQPREALDWSLKAKKELDGIKGSLLVAEHNFYYSLILASLYPEIPASEQQQYWKQLESNQKQMKIWANNCEANFLHRYLLVAAEMARLSDRQLEAMNLYDRAIQSARENEYIQNEALSNELAAKFYLKLDKEKIAQVYLIEAYYCYARWGAKAKVDELEQRYPDLLAPILFREKIKANPSTTNSIASETFTSTSAGGAALLDLTTVMKAAQTLSEEIVLEQLLSTLMQVLIENAGAENGCLILPKDGNLVIEAIQSSRSTQANVLQSIPIESSSVVPVTVINYVWRTQKTLVTNDVTTLNMFASDAYIIQRQPKSLLCSPIMNRGKLIGIVYLENNLIAGTFTSDRINILNLLTSQAAISLDNARLYQNLQRSEAREREKAEKLAQTLKMLQEETRRIEFRADIDSALTQLDTLPEILKRCTAAVVEHLDAAFARIWTLNAKENVLELQASSGLYTHINGSHSRIPVSKFKIGWIAQTCQPHLTNDVYNDERISDRDWARREGMISFAGYPLIVEGQLVGVIALFARHALNDSVLKVLELVSHEIALGIKRKQVEEALQKSEMQLRQKAQHLEETLHQLQQTQLQMIQSEKMSALGNLVAGVAHEINNPVGFISGNISEAMATVGDLINHLRLYQEKFDNPGEEIEKDALDIDLEYLLEDLPKMLSSMKVGCDRIRNISTSLRTFSRADRTSKVSANLHEGLDTTLMILQYRLKAKETRPAIQVIKEYAEIPSVKCYFGQLNQVFMNIISNAIDALEESNQGRSYAAIEKHPNMISIKTEIAEDRQSVLIKIKDNGLGMTKEVKSRIFDHLFTTKAVGKGTGLGLSISRQIVQETHGGSLTCSSALGEGAEFAIMLPLDRS